MGYGLQLLGGAAGGFNRGLDWVNKQDMENRKFELEQNADARAQQQADQQAELHPLQVQNAQMQVQEGGLKLKGAQRAEDQAALRQAATTAFGNTAKYIAENAANPNVDDHTFLTTVAGNYAGFPNGFDLKQLPNGMWAHVDNRTGQIDGQPMPAAQARQRINTPEVANAAQMSHARFLAMNGDPTLLSTFSTTNYQETHGKALMRQADAAMMNAEAGKNQIQADGSGRLYVFRNGQQVGGPIGAARPDPNGPAWAKYNRDVALEEQLARAAREREGYIAGEQEATRGGNTAAAGIYRDNRMLADSRLAGLRAKQGVVPQSDYKPQTIMSQDANGNQVPLQYNAQTGQWTKIVPVDPVTTFRSPNAKAPQEAGAPKPEDPGYTIPAVTAPRTADAARQDPDYRRIVESQRVEKANAAAKVKQERARDDAYKGVDAVTVPKTADEAKKGLAHRQERARRNTQYYFNDAGGR